VKFAAVASEPVAAQVAHQILSEAGTVADALIAGFLAAAAARPSVLLSPVQALLAGPGVGSRAFDGRARQPGLGLPRPRGVASGQRVPDAARVAVPASLGLLALLHAHDGKTSFQRLTEPAVEYAAEIGAESRSALLDRIGRRGPSALREAITARPLLALAGRAEGGLLSERDLSEVRPQSRVPREIETGDRRALLVPWPAPDAQHRLVEVIAAADARGVLAALAYSPDDEGVEVSELGLTLSRDAAVVQRGVVRVQPGEPIPCPAPIVLALFDMRVTMALGIRASQAVSAADLLEGWSKTSAAAKLLLAARAAAGGERAFGVLRSETQQVRKLSA
jgi:gamma-glutamyltranspeptidase/glutathione hydrolase